MHQIFSALEYLHSKSISHRDIKPENFMLYKQGDLSCIKMIDFGLSKDYSEGETMHTMSGSPYYIAPEVFMQKYNQKIDVWSMGVVLYIMLSGKVPFPGRTEPEIIHNVIKGVFHFNHPAFEFVSEECKDLIKKCLVKDFTQRYTATQCINHPWIQTRYHTGLSSGTIGDGVSQTVIQGIDEIHKTQFKNATLQYFTKKVNGNNFPALKELLGSEDSANSGFLDSDSFRRCLSLSHMKVTDNEVESLLKELDPQNSGQVNYRDFLKFSYLC